MLPDRLFNADFKILHDETLNILLAGRDTVRRNLCCAAHSAAGY